MFLLFTPLNSQLEKAREATDAANLRAAYAEVMTEALTSDSVTPKTVTLTQKQDGWQDATINAGKIGDTAATSITVGSGKTVTVDFTNNKVTFTTN